MRKIVFPTVLVWAFLGLGLARGQYSATEDATIPDAPPLLPPPTEPIFVPTQSCPSPYVQWCRPGSCYCPVGRDGPIQTELYLRAGWSLPFGNGVYGEHLKNGWSFQGGARVFFFKPTPTEAFFVDLGVTNVWNPAGPNPPPLQLNIIVPNPLGVATRVVYGANGVPGVTIRDLNQTFVNVGVGYSWFLPPPKFIEHGRWRWIVDGGGRYGTASAQFYEIRHRSDVIQGAYFGVESNLEIPWGCCTFVYGFRTEYNYSWIDVLQTQNFADLQFINLMFTAGVRF